MDNSLPGDLPDIDNIQNTPPIEPSGAEKPKTTGQPFQQYMQEAKGGNQAQAEQVNGPSPMNLPQNQQVLASTPTMESIQGQMAQSHGTLNTLQDQLNTKNLTLKQSQKYLLRNKLSDANAQIRTVAEKTGVHVGSEPGTNIKQSPLKRYLAYVTDSQNQIASVQSKIKELAASGKSISPGDMLLIQVKLNKAQQALEYSSVLLGKAVDDIKMLFNVQI